MQYTNYMKVTDKNGTKLVLIGSYYQLDNGDIQCASTFEIYKRGWN